MIEEDLDEEALYRVRVHGDAPIAIPCRLLAQSPLETIQRALAR